MLKCHVFMFYFTGAFDYLKSNPVDPIDVSQLEECCGVGVVVTKEEIVTVTREVIAANHNEILEKRYRFNIGNIMGK